MMALVGVFIGLCMNQVLPLMSASWNPFIMMVCVMAFCNASASVANEFAMKQNAGLDINIQNAVLYTFCVISSIAYCWVVNSVKLESVQSFLSGFDRVAALVVLLQLSAGLMVSRILKYA